MGFRVAYSLQLVVEGQEPAVVAAGRAVSRPALVEQLRDAVAALASRYEHLANAHLHEDPVVSLPAALGGKRAWARHSSQRHGTEDPRVVGEEVYGLPQMALCLLHDVGTCIGQVSLNRSL